MCEWERGKGMWHVCRWEEQSGCKSMRSCLTQHSDVDTVSPIQYKNKAMESQEHMEPSSYNCVICSARTGQEQSPSPKGVASFRTGTNLGTSRVTGGATGAN